MSQSFTEFQAAHQARLEGFASARSAEIERAAAITAKAEVAFATAHGAELKAHEEGTHDRLIAFQKFAADTYDPVVRDYTVDPSRANVAALAEALIAVEDAAWEQCGLNLDRNSSGVGAELLHALIAPRIASASPEAAQRLAYHGNGHIGGLSTSYRRAVEALRERDVIAAGQHLLEVESALSATARTGSRGGGDGAERFAFVRFGGLPERRDAALAQLDRRAFEAENGTPAERAQRAAAMQEASTQRLDGENVGDAFGRILARLKGRAQHAVAELSAPAEAQPARRKVRASTDEDAAAMRVSDGSPVTI